MRTRKLSVGLIPEKVETPEERAQRKFDNTMFQMNEYARKQAEARDKLIKDLTESKSPVNRLEWLDGVAENMWEGALYEWLIELIAREYPADHERFQEAAEPGSPARLVWALGVFAQELGGRMLRNADRPSSSSAFHNASMIAQQEARHQVFRQIIGWLRYLEAETKFDLSMMY